MSVRGTPRITTGSQLTPGGQRVAGRDLARRVERLGAGGPGAVWQMRGTGRAVACAPFRKVSPPGTFTCSADIFGWFPDSLYRSAL